jgi:hypothetical protein
MWDLINESEDHNPDSSCASGENVYRFLSDMTKSDIYGFTNTDPLDTVVQTDAAILNSGGSL